MKIRPVFYLSAILIISFLFSGFRAFSAAAKVDTSHLPPFKPIPIPMRDRIINYEKSVNLGKKVDSDGLAQKIRTWLNEVMPGLNNAVCGPDDGLVIKDSLNSETVDGIPGHVYSYTGTGTFKVSMDTAGDSGPLRNTAYYLIRFDWTVKLTDSGCLFRAFHFFEKPVEKGISNEFSKIEYRWWDYRHGHPWSGDDQLLFDGVNHHMSDLLKGVGKALQVTRFNVLALYENGGHHLEFSNRARQWLDQLALDSNFTIDYIQSSDLITDRFLNNYQLIIQLDYVPYGWKTPAIEAFQRYIETGGGGWVGFHHATLLGDFDGFHKWQWFSDFMGGITWKDYIPAFASGEVTKEDGSHPVMNGLPAHFVIPKEEWYTYDKSPRPNVHVIASVDESSYAPVSTVKMGDHPVVWSNDHVKARNVYIFMGHSPVLFESEEYRHLVRNAIFWAAGKSMQTGRDITRRSEEGNETNSQAGNEASGSARSPVNSSARPHVIAFYSTNVETDHVDFARDALRFYSDLALRKNFILDTTSNWEDLTDCSPDKYQLVIWLNEFPHNSRQRAAFENYMEHGGAWLGFHVSAYNDKDTKWPWFVRFLGGAVFYNNSWPPLPAKLIADDTTHPLMAGLPGNYIAPINEWYGWKPDPRQNKDVKVLLTLDTSNYPLGKKDILRQGDIPVVWTNTRYKMLYMNMGHGDQNFMSPIQNKLFENAIKWLGIEDKNIASGHLANPVVYVNQVGFERFGPKTALIGNDHELPEGSSFKLIDEGSGNIVFEGALGRSQHIDEWAPGRWFYQMDLSSFTRSGKYRIVVMVNGEEVRSEPFLIADNALARATISSIVHYYHQQRACTPQELAADVHLPLSGSDKRVDMHGGWCDASGDVSKYFSHLAYANFMSPQQTPLVTWSMANVAEQIPGLLSKWSLKDPLEKEAIYGADYMMRALSDEGYFYMIVFSYFNKDPNARKVVGLLANSVTTDQYQCAFREGGGMAIAALARISQWKQHGDFTSEQYLDGAKRAFAHLLINNTKYDDDGKENIIDDYCALMAASELWIASGDDLYQKEARKRAANLAARMTADGYFMANDTGRPFWHASDAGLPLIALARYLDKETDAGLRQKTLAVMRRALDYELKVTNNVDNPFGYARQSFLFNGKVKNGFFIPHENETGWWWQGEDARLGSLATAALACGKLVDRQPGCWGVPDSLARFAQDQVSWILGCNPYSMCFLYGYGKRNVPYMHSNFGHGSEVGGVSNGITGKEGNPDGSGIDFRTEAEGNEWRWTEQWIPHAAWFLQAVAAMAHE